MASCACKPAGSRVPDVAPLELGISGFMAGAARIQVWSALEAWAREFLREFSTKELV